MAPPASARRGVLYLVAVPIGNLEDITLRALRHLREARLVACEDTRRTGKLLELLGVKRPEVLLSVHDHNETERIPRVLAELAKGDVVLVSDAGTPAVSDPGYRLVRAAIEAEFDVVPIPGPCAAIAALSASGLPTDRFTFTGFPPAKSGPRNRWLAGWRTTSETLIIYVGPHKLDEFLRAAAEVLGEDRPAVIARELTKRFEEFRRGTLGELAAEPGVVRGEVVVLVGGQTDAEARSGVDPEARIRELLAEGLAPPKVAKTVAKETTLSRDEAYKLALSIRSDGGSEPGVG